MRLNKFLAQHTGLSRRSADKAIAENRVTVNGQPVSQGYTVRETDLIRLDAETVRTTVHFTTIMLNKPVGFVCSRAGQGSKTIYELLPKKYRHLNPVGRLDKDSSGLLLLTNDGLLANKLTHPKYQKKKVYTVKIDRPLKPRDLLKLQKGVKLVDGLSKFKNVKISGETELIVVLSEGRNRQIRRTLSTIGYRVQTLHRTEFGEYALSDLKSGAFRAIL